MEARLEVAQPPASVWTRLEVVYAIPVVAAPVVDPEGWLYLVLVAPVVACAEWPVVPSSDDV